MKLYVKLCLIWHLHAEFQWYSRLSVTCIHKFVFPSYTFSVIICLQTANNEYPICKFDNDTKIIAVTKICHHALWIKRTHSLHCSSTYTKHNQMII